MEKKKFNHACMQVIHDSVPPCVQIFRTSVSSSIQRIFPFQETSVDGTSVKNATVINAYISVPRHI